MGYNYESAISVTHYKLLINRKCSNTDAYKMFTMLAHTTLLSLLFAKLTFSTHYAVTTLYYRPIFKLENHFTSAVMVSAFI